MFRASVLKILACVFILAITFDVPVFATLDPNAYVDSKNQFSIYPPSGWTIDASGTLGTTVVLVGPIDSNFRINMNLIIEATSLSLSDYVSATKSQLANGLNNYQLVSETSTTIGGVAASELVNTFTQGSYNIEDKQDILVQNQKAYIITSSSLQTNYQTYQPSMDESVQTFRLTGTAGAAFPWTIIIVGVIVAGILAVGLTIFFVRKKRQVSIPPTMPQPSPIPPPPSSSLSTAASRK